MLNISAWPNDGGDGIRAIEGLDLAHDAHGFMKQATDEISEASDHGYCCASQRRIMVAPVGSMTGATQTKGRPW